MSSPHLAAEPGVVSDWTRFHALADAQNAALRDALYRALTGLVDALDLDVLADAIREGSIGVAEGTLNLDGFEVMLGDALRRSLRGVLVKSGDTAIAQLSVAPTLADSAHVALLGRFNMTDPDALAWIDGETGKLVRAITHEQRELLVDAVHNTFGIRARTPDTLAREIRSMIGLTPNQRSYVSRYRQRLTQQVASGDLKLRDGWVDTLTERYQRNWLKYRSQCLIGSTPITGAAVTAVYRRWYEGDVVRITTASGRQLTATPQHPHLTARGWVSAEQIAVGDDFICDALQQQVRTTGNVDVDRPPPMIEQIFRTLALTRVMERQSATSVHFHGEWAEADVDIVRSERPLRVGQCTTLFEPLTQHFFAKADPSRARFCDACRRLLSVNQAVCCGLRAQLDPGFSQMPLYQFPRRLLTPSDSTDRSTSEIGGFDFVVGEHAPPMTSLSWGGAMDANSDSSILESSLNRRVAAVQTMPDFGQAQISSIETDRVVNLVRTHWRGHIYNLSTADGYFTADGLYTGNTIAQTETIAASSAGRDLAWQRGVASGLINTAQMEQVWIVTNSPTTCPECRPLNGARAPIGGTFAGGITGPPLHPRCRCAKALIRVGTALGKFEQDLPDYAPRSLQMQPRIPQRALR
jgi:hypothetical protein